LLKFDEQISAKSEHSRIWNICFWYVL